MVNNIQDKDLILLIVGGILIMLLLAIAFIVFFNLSQKKIFQEKMKAQSLQLQHQEQLLHATLMTQEEERRRIAKDLHDDIGSKLNVIKLNLHRVRQLGQANELK
ncbi:MAG: histidine kinase dimerization/phosphoacceptor domain-containing protein, partial [Bacteroidota bacterium]